jgi:membrane protein required for colicin V production
MHIFDIIFIVFAAILIVLGIKRGLIDEVTRLSAVVVGFVGALLFYRNVAQWVNTMGLPEQLVTAVSFITLFIAVFMVILILGTFIKKAARLALLGWIDRLCGGCLGLVKAFFFGWIVVIALSSIPFVDSSDCCENSRVFSLLHAISPSLQATITQHGNNVVKNIQEHTQPPATDSVPVSETPSQPLSKDQHNRHVHHH